MRFDAIAYQKRLRGLHRAGQLTHAEFAVADTMTWSCRQPGRAEAQVSYRRIAELAHVAYATAVDAIAKLRQLGLLTWRKTRLRVRWGLGIATRQWRNVYTFVAAPVTESTFRPTDSNREKKKEAQGRESAPRTVFQTPIRSVAEQLRILRGG